ncbi:MAG TPA: hypothetical protein PLU58_06245 [Saprospiraceae bacterium]|nr:hypothetical protein [Saprospiraceae bacterium]HQW95382.1 hypothetical protein [Saprospiraceae bacterium]
MSCACINQYFDLHVTSMGPTRMIVEDQSVWMDDDGFSSVLTIDVSVRSLTSRGINFVYPLYVGKRNILTAKELYGGKDGECIKDDIFCFEIGPNGNGACGVKMSVNRAYLQNAKCTLLSLMANAIDETDYNLIQDVKMLIEVIEAHVELGRIEDARNIYKILSNKLKEFTCECCN